MNDFNCLLSHWLTGGRYIVATQMSDTLARRVFPCFDEPDLKATFNVTVLRKQPLISLSNTELLRTDHRFASLPRLSCIR